MLLNFLSLVCYRVWSVKTGEMLNTLIHHCEAVLHLRFSDGIMVTCSKVKRKIICLFSIFWYVLQLRETGNWEASREGIALSDHENKPIHVLLIALGTCRTDP